MVELTSVRLKNTAVNTVESVSNRNHSDPSLRLPSVVMGVPSMQEDSKSVAHRLENLSRQVLPERPARWVDSENTASRPCDFERSVNKPKLDLVSRFEDKFPHWKQASRDSSRIEHKLPQRMNRKEDVLANQPSTVDKSSGHPNTSRGTPVMRERSRRQEELQRRSHQEKHIKDQSLYPKTRGNQQDRSTETCGKEQSQENQRPSLLSREKPSTKVDQDHELIKNGLARLQETGGVENLPPNSLRLKGLHSQDGHDMKSGVFEQSLLQELVSQCSPAAPMASHCCREGGTEVVELPLLSQRQPSRELQEPRERVSSQLQRHQPHIKPHERSSQRQHLPERVISSHEHEAKLIQRQQYLQEKVRSRKMLLGSVIPSDMTFSSEACRNWQSANMLSLRYREEKTYKHMVLSADSGVSMGEGSSASRRNSETETDDQAKDDLPTIIVEIGEIVNRRVPSKCQKCQRNKCDMKDASSQHSHPPSEAETPPSSPLTESITSAKIQTSALDVMSPPPHNRVYQCRVIRDKHTYGTMFYPVYRMYLERDGRAEMLLLTARKRKKCSTSKYLICRGNDELRRKSSSLVGKLSSNLVGTRFHLATYAKGGNRDDGDSRLSPLKFDSLLLFYETNFLGTKGPRRMKVFMPELGREVEDELNLLERVRDGTMEGVLTLVNKEPEWDRETLSHILYFEGRVTKSSVKNFQLVEPPDESSVLLQFGKIGRNEFTLDYHPPINAVQAFAIALSSFDGKIACE